MTTSNSVICSTSTTSHSSSVCCHTATHSTSTPRSRRSRFRLLNHSMHTSSRCRTATCKNRRHSFTTQRRSCLNQSRRRNRVTKVRVIHHHHRCQRSCFLQRALRSRLTALSSTSSTTCRQKSR